MVTLMLFNGSTTRDAWNAESPEFIDDWKPETRKIECQSVGVTYATTVTVFYANGDEQIYEFNDTGLLVVDGVFYGDFEITGSTGTGSLS